MSDWNVSEVLQLVTKLNQELDEQDFVEVSFWLTTNGSDVTIELCGAGLREQIWDSWEDEREQLPPSHIEDSPELGLIEFYVKLTTPVLEPLGWFLRRRAQEVLKEVARQVGYVKLQQSDTAAPGVPLMPEEEKRMYCPGGEDNGRR